MPNEQVVNPDQTSAFESPWSYGQRALRALWEFCWFVFCRWTPKPFNPWRLFWLHVFEAKIEGMPFVHSRARIAIPWKLILHDRACLGDRADAYLLGEIELGQRATVAPEVNLSAGSDDSSQPGMPLTPTAKIAVGADAFIGAGSVVTEDVPSHVFALGNPSPIFRPR
jgi:putative colanic acid biosynthesis acetyltransferase WcaF